LSAKLPLPRRGEYSSSQRKTLSDRFSPERAPHLRTAAVIPAYNEAGRITNVLSTIAQARLVDEIVVVTDGCSDSTADEARGLGARLARGEVLHATGEPSTIPLRVLELPQNIGKGGAMTYGAHRTEAEVLLFLDADLIGLRPEQVDSLLEPMLRRDVEQRADMTLGLFGAARGGIMGWWLSVCHRKWDGITGQRAIRRDVFLAVPGLTRSRFGVETAITRYVRCVWKLRTENVTLHNLTHPMKEEKIGLVRGFKHRMEMYLQIVGYQIFDTVSHSASSEQRAKTVQMRKRFSNDKV
jgi:glycosyltransferase involved in cell wall biosynthesis